MAIVPAFNEGERIAEVLAVLRRVPGLDGIVVVDDGSVDDTSAKAEAAAVLDRRLAVVRHPVNCGKGQAIETGLQAAQAEVVLLLDADLQDLRPRHVEALAAPVLSGERDMSIGLFRGGRWNTDLAHRLTPWLSGQRCLRAALWPEVCPAAARGYGVETALTVAALLNQWRTVWLTLDGVHHPPSEFHRGLWHGIKNRARMYGQIARAAWISFRWQQGRSRSAS